MPRHFDSAAQTAAAASPARSVRKLSIAIPVYNEIQTLPKLLERIRQVAFPVEVEVVLVDDGSTDGTSEYLTTLKAQPGLRVFHNPSNRGKAFSIRTAIERASGDVIVIQDADLEYDPADLPRLLEAIASGRTDVVYGSRFLGAWKGMAASHRWGNRFLTWLTNRMYGTGLTDMETCYKMATVGVWRSFRIESDRFELEPEITAKIVRSGGRIVEVPISFSARTKSQGKKISWRDGFGAMKVLLRHWRRAETGRVPLAAAAAQSGGDGLSRADPSNR